MLLVAYLSETCYYKSGTEWQYRNDHKHDKQNI